MPNPKNLSSKSPKSLESLDEKVNDVGNWSDSSGKQERSKPEISKFGSVNGEETEDASEDGEPKSCCQELKEQVYLQELQLLKASLKELKYGRHPDFVRGVKKLEGERAERLRRIEAGRQYEEICIEKEFLKEKNEAILEFEEKKNELKTELIDDLEQKKRQIVQDVFSMDLAMEEIEVAPPTTRSLRSRPHVQLPIKVSQEKIKPPKPRQTFLKFYLSDDEIQKDLNEMELAIKTEYGPEQKGALGSTSAKVSKEVFVETETAPYMDSRIEDGKLFYEKKWFHRGQPVFVEGIDLPNKVSGVISSISQDNIWIRKVADQTKLRVTISQLMKGTSAIKRRA